MCLYPKLIENPKYRANKKNGGVIPTVFDERVKLVPIGCGKCIECQKKKSREWQVRLHEELRINNNCYFVTLSFSDVSLVALQEYEGLNILNGYELDNKTCKLAVRRFLERWRKKYKKSVKHWLVTELGQKNTERIHIHGLLWTDKDKIKDLESIWKYGNIWLGDYVTDRTIGYIVKYLSKSDILHPNYKPIIMTSAGIGRNYINRIDSNNNMFKGVNTDELYRSRNGMKLSLPIYYKNLLYTDDEKEQLWLNKLNQNVRYVLGQKIDISKGEEDYYNVLKDAQMKNVRLKYNDGNNNDWNKKRYEWERRLIKKIERIKKVKRNIKNLE